MSNRTFGPMPNARQELASIHALCLGLYAVVRLARRVGLGRERLIELMDMVIAMPTGDTP